MEGLFLIVNIVNITSHTEKNVATPLLMNWCWVLGVNDVWISSVVLSTGSVTTTLSPAALCPVFRVGVDTVYQNPLKCCKNRMMRFCVTHNVEPFGWQSWLLASVWRPAVAFRDEPFDTQTPFRVYSCHVKQLFVGYWKKVKLKIENKPNFRN